MKVFAWLSAATVVCVVMFTFALGVALGGSPQIATSSPVGSIPGIPPDALALYQQAADKYHIDWAIIAAIYSIESDHGRSTAAGVHSGVNFAGCCAGPGQFSVTPRPSTWDFYGEGGDVYSMADSVPATARYLKASGAPGDYHAAVWSYNHSDAYVSDVLAKADEYRYSSVTPVVSIPGEEVSGSPKQIIDEIVLPLARANGIDRSVAQNDAANAIHGPTDSGGRSDHEGPPDVAWAADMSNGITTPEEDRLAAVLAERFGIPWTGSGLVSATHGEYRYQLIYRASDHLDHVHLGIRVAR